MRATSMHECWHGSAWHDCQCDLRADHKCWDRPEYSDSGCWSPAEPENSAKAGLASAREDATASRARVDQLTSTRRQPSPSNPTPTEKAES